MNKNNENKSFKNIINLDEPLKFNFKPYELQKNLKKFIKKYPKFSVMYNGKILEDFRIEISKTPDKKVSFYRIFYDIPNRGYLILPLEIFYIDPLNMEINNNCSIEGLHRTDEIDESITGSDLLNIAIKINKILGVDKIYITSDQASVPCNNDETMDLSFIKLIEKYETFYMNHGFNIDVSNVKSPLIKFHNNEDLVKEFKKLVNNIRKIKVKDIINEYIKTMDIVNLAIKDNYKKKITNC